MLSATSPAPTDDAADEAAQRLLKGGLLGYVQEADPDAVIVEEALSRGPTPQEVVLRCEDRAEEWHFDEAVHRSRLLEHRGLSVAFKERERQARERQAKDLQDHEQRVAELLLAVEAEERRAALELAGLREELVEAKHQTEELEEDCEAQVQASEQRAREERQKRAALEQELLKERQSADRATQYITEIEDREGQLMRLKRTRMAENRGACQRQLLELQRNAEREIQEIGGRLREEVDAIRQQIERKKADTQRGCDAWVQRRRDVTAEAEKQIVETVDTRVRQGLATVHMQALDAREESFNQIQGLQAGDFQQEAVLKERIGAALMSVECSVAERDHASIVEKRHKDQLASATDILGCKLPNNRYALHEHRRMTSAFRVLAGD